ncbi:MAG: Rho termination factor N-terminal domain-containing protein [Solirubrobacteraceae bacterium]
MAVLDRSELEASPLADLHAIADQIGLDGFRRLRKADLIDAILGEPSAAEDSREASDDEDGAPPTRARKRRTPRARRGRAEPDGESAEEARTDGDAEGETDEDVAGEGRGRASSGRRGRGRGGRGEAAARRGGEDRDEEERIAEGVVEVLGNGSAFLRVDPPEPSDDDVYVSAAQVRRCELVSGDRVTGPVRTPRRSERYPSLVRIDTINGASADSVSDGARYEDLPVAWPAERLALGSENRTLEAIEWLTPLGKGSRATIVGPRAAGKSETLRRIFEALKDRDDLDVSVVLAGARPEEIAQWGEASPAPVAALSFAASADSQSQAVERALDTAKRLAARGGDAVVLIDGLDGLQPQAARRALAAARNLRDAGSLTVIATAGTPAGGETTVIALDPAMAAAGDQPILDLAASGTLQVELLVGEEGAEAIHKARAAALEASRS